MEELPDKLSDLLELALDDIQGLLRRKNYREDMNHWFVRTVRNNCTVCLAGAVMARTLHLAEETHLRGRRFCVTPYGYFDLTSRIPEKLWAIEYMRRGDLSLAFEHISSRWHSRADKDLLHKLSNYILARFDSKLARAPWPAYRHIVRKLREADL